MSKKFNFVDLLVVLFVCAVIVFVGFKFIFKDFNNASQDGASGKEVVCTVKVAEVIESTANSLPSSGKIYDEKGVEIGEVFSKEIVDAEVVELKSDGQYVKTVNPEKLDVYIKFRADVTIKDEGYFFNQKVCLGAGKTGNFKAKNAEFYGTILSIE